jgi:hypothetical protein
MRSHDAMPWVIDIICFSRIPPSSSTPPPSTREWFHDSRLQSTYSWSYWFIKCINITKYCNACNLRKWSWFMECIDITSIVILIYGVYRYYKYRDSDSWSVSILQVSWFRFMECIDITSIVIPIHGVYRSRKVCVWYQSLRGIFKKVS